MTIRTRSCVVVSLILVCALLASCSGSSGSTDSANPTLAPDVSAEGVVDTEAPTGTDSPTTENSTAETPSTDTGAPEVPIPGDTEPPDGEPLTGGDPCMIGTWELDNVAFAAGLEDLSSGIGGVTDVSVEGKSIVEFRDGGAFTGGYDDFIATMTSEGAPTVVITFEGAGEGSWQTDDGVLDMEPSSFDVLTETSVDGLPMGDFGFELGDLASFQTEGSPYTCDDQRLAITVTDGIGFEAQRID